jgi:hypothetical protein
MKNKGWWILFLVFIVSGVRASDSLRISVGYGTLYGGGLGAKIEHRLLHDKIKFHVGVSGGLLPLMSYNTLKNHKHLFMLYENIDKRLVFNTEGIDGVYTDKSKIPFSFNISYNIYKNVDGFIGIGTIGRVYKFDRIPGYISHYPVYLVECIYTLSFYKILSLTLSASYKFNRFYFFISFSKGLKSSPSDDMVDWAIKHSYFISFTVGYNVYDLNFNKIKLWKR